MNKPTLNGWTKIAGLIVGIIFAAALVYFNVNSNSKKIDVNVAEIKAVDAQSDTNRLDIANLKKRILHQRKD